MKILTEWLRHYLPVLPVSDAQLAEDLTLRGIAVEGVFPLHNAAGEATGSLFDMDITTNRVDAMNHYGIAREAAAIYNLSLTPLDTALPETAPASTPLPVRIDAPDRCGRFTAQVIRNVTIAPTAGLTAEFFASLGQRSISNAVDATNLILFGMGHPTHAFDLDKIRGGIVVRLAHPGEQLRLLDGSTRTLVPDDLVIADEVKTLSLAGVMGGWDSMITAETRNVLVEAAWFEPAGIRASSRRHLIHTDASHRFERGADFNAAPVANALVTKHILAACGGTLEGGLIDVAVPEARSQTAGRPPIPLSIQKVQRHLGTTTAPEGITRELVVQFLGALGCQLTPTGDDSFAVQLPSWRLDLSREIDLIEEIARVYGYNRFANTLPTPGIVIAQPTARAERAVRARLLALGYSEAIGSTFASTPDASFFAPATPAVPLENPLSEEAALLRPSLVPGMVAMLAHNLNRDVLSVRLFESGAVFTGAVFTNRVESVTESRSLSLGLTGPVAPTNLASTSDSPFFAVKGAIESLLSLFQIPAPVFTATRLPAYLEAGRAAAVVIDSEPIGCLGQLAASDQAARKLRQPIFLAEIDLERLLTFPLRHVTARELSRFQAAERDFSFVFPDQVQFQQIADAIAALAIPELQRLTPVELWRDPKKFPGVYSTLLRTVFQSQERTLRDEELSAWQSAIIATLQSLGGTLRS